MKTKAFSKEGLSAVNKLDPREQKKDEVVGFLGDMIEKLGHDVERNEAEIELLHVQVKKSKRDAAKAERVTELQDTTERHKWHQGRLELLLRAVENDGVEATDVEDMQDNIKEYVDNNQDVDFVEDETMYDDFNLDEEGGKFGLPGDLEKVSSHDDASGVGEPLEPTPSVELSKQKSRPSQDLSAPHRKPSQQIKSPLPTLATLNTVPTTTASTVNRDMKPAPPPLKPPGEPLKYASAAAAAAANDKAGIGIAPLPPPPPGVTAVIPSAISSIGLAPTQPEASAKSSATTSPAASTTQPMAPLPPTSSQPAAPGGPMTDRAAPQQKSRAPSHSSASVSSPAVSLAQLTEASSRHDVPPLPTQNGTAANEATRRPAPVAAQDHDRDVPLASVEAPQQSNGIAHSPISTSAPPSSSEEEEDEPVYHLPASLHELVSAYEAVKDAAPPIHSPEHQRLLSTSYATRPDSFDAEKPRHYKPTHASAYTPPHYPQEPLPIFDDPRLYNKIDTDSLFYSFYYRQGSHQQYLAARALKNQSWRFHKQYQTWFQRHEEPKNITEDYEQGTYRFFDYESTWYVSLLPFPLVS